MKRIVGLICGIVIVWLVTIGSAVGQNVYVATPPQDPVTSGSRYGYGELVDVIPSNYAVTTTFTTATASRALTSIPNRRQVVFWINTNNKELWVNIGSSTNTVNSGIKVTTTATFDVGPGVPISFIASEAFSFAVIQLGR